jgi:hypothetical protein
MLSPIPEGSADAVRIRVLAFAKLIRAIRKELGHSRTKINPNIIGGILVTDFK